MKKQIQAVYANGSFRPVNPAEIQLDEGETVWLTVFNAEERARYVLDLAQQIYEGLSEAEIATIEAAVQRRPLREETVVQFRENTDARVARIKALMHGFYEGLPQEGIDAMEKAMRRRDTSSQAPAASKTTAIDATGIVGRLTEYYVRQNIHPEHFACPHQSDCRNFAHEGRMTEAKMSMVGSQYGARYPRIVVVSLDPPVGDNGVFTDARHRTTEYVSAKHEADDYTHTRVNPHWAMTQIIVKDILCLFGYEAPPKSAVVEKSYSGRPIDNVSRYFAHVNVAKCSMNHPEKAHSHPNVLERCGSSHLYGELALLQPDILLSQGKETHTIVGNLVGGRKVSISDLPHAERINIWGNTMLWLPMYHPSRFTGKIRQTWDYYANAIRQWKDMVGYTHT